MLPGEILWRAHQSLLSVPLDHDFWDMFPYILEEHGPGSRASVMRDPSTATAREAKRKEGVFYTPSDVADFMVRHALQNFGAISSRSKCLDPASGTGVFLLALCRAAAQRCSPAGDFDCFAFVTESLYGCDISPHALDAAAFVLLRECLPSLRSRNLSPWAAWQAIRLNLAEVDSLTIAAVNGGPTPDESQDSRLVIKRRLINEPGAWIEAVQANNSHTDQSGRSGLGLFGKASLPIGALFAEAVAGFDILVGNPPYVPLGQREDYQFLSSDYRCLARGKAGVRENCYPLFIEMTWRLTVPSRNATALVTPLSIAFHSGAQFEDCRHAMYWRGGRWQFAFFDREPHALFGEEVKTRNAILFRFENSLTPRRGEPAEIETGPLRKWTSRTRRELFDSIDFTPLDTAAITSGIPKLKGTRQAHAFAVLRQRPVRLPAWCTRISMCSPAEASQPTDSPRVFVGGTAYNFLNVFRSFSVSPEDSSPLSESSIHCLEVRSEEDAQAVFALLSSRLAFWLWHVLGDGFHVAGWLFDEISFSRASFTPAQVKQLATLGASLWAELQNHRIVSVNGGKQTVAFRPLACNRERDAIDSLLLDAASLPPEFSDELRDFVHQTVVIDPKDSRRQHLQTYFATPKPE